MDVPPHELHGDVLYQLAALDGLARVAGTARRATSSRTAPSTTASSPTTRRRDAVVRRRRRLRPALALLGLAGSAIARGRSRARASRFVREAFVDRGYLADGTLVPRSRARAPCCPATTAIAARAVAPGRPTAGRDRGRRHARSTSRWTRSACTATPRERSAMARGGPRRARRRRASRVEAVRVTPGRASCPTATSALLVELGRPGRRARPFRGLERPRARPASSTSSRPPAPSASSSIRRVLPLSAAAAWVDRSRAARASSRVDERAVDHPRALRRRGSRRGRRAARARRGRRGRAATPSPMWRVAFGGFAPGFAYLVDRPRSARRSAAGDAAHRCPGGRGRPRRRVQRRLPAVEPRRLAADRPTDAVLWDETADRSRAAHARHRRPLREAR